jgi:hypothetical protein
MVIVEPRKHKHLKYVCENFDKNMCKTWDLYVFHGKSSRDFAEASVKDIQGRKVFLIALDTDNLNAQQYNELFKKSSFWDQVTAENILVFQTDTVLCPASKYKINDFVRYNYIGCSSNSPAEREKEWVTGDENGHMFYGVGGLSFRKKSFMMKCINDNPNIRPDFAEDVFFSNCVAKTLDRPIAGIELNRFCSQNVFEQPSFGAHKLSRMVKDHLEPFYNFCPPARVMNS